MRWWKAIIIGLGIYLGLLGLSLLAFVYLGLGYHYSSLANAISSILYFPFGARSFYHWFADVFFWALVIGIAIRFLTKKEKKKT